MSGVPAPRCKLPVVTVRTPDGMVFYKLGRVECFAWWKQCAEGDETDIVHFQFEATPQQLAAAGIAPLESLDRAATRPRGKARIDADGDELKLAGRRRSGVVKIEVKKPLERALRHLPDYSVVGQLLESFVRGPAAQS